MKKMNLLPGALLAFGMLSLYACSNDKPAEATEVKDAAASVIPDVPKFGTSYASQVEWGKHLVTVGGCNDCHTPKVMSPQGPVDDTSRMLSGHYGNIPTAAVDRKQFEAKGYIATADFTAWVGPWGVSYTANLTPDETGTGKWTEDQFLNALKNKVLHGLTGARPLLPPMSMMPVSNYNDDEMKAIFAFLKSIKPVRNIVPTPLPPASMKKAATQP
jgi:hypothetical protein